MASGPITQFQALSELGTAEAVEVLLKDFENHEQRSPPEARFDFAEVRKDLGLPT